MLGMQVARDRCIGGRSLCSRMFHRHSHLSLGLLFLFRLFVRFIVWVENMNLLGSSDFGRLGSTGGSVSSFVFGGKRVGSLEKFDNLWICENLLGELRHIGPRVSSRNRH
mmetsp:Transcript_128336/g.369568  ORF Transcript_128336/g.369568 Transcript_128336/m.369568 type:complete len:110 (-) Transcript_128336:284-613(-)